MTDSVRSEFISTLEFIGDEMQKAYDRIMLAKNIWSLRVAYTKELDQTPAFWNITLPSLVDSGYMHMARIYDSRRTTHGLPLLLKLITRAPELFEQESFSINLPNNPYVEGSAKSMGEPDPDAVALDNQLINPQENPVVEKLKAYRDEAESHTDYSTITSLESGSLEPSIEDIEELLKLARKIVNRYVGLFKSDAFVTPPTAHEDYMTLLRIARTHLAVT